MAMVFPGQVPRIERQAQEAANLFDWAYQLWQTQPSNRATYEQALRRQGARVVELLRDPSMSAESRRRLEQSMAQAATVVGTPAGAPLSVTAAALTSDAGGVLRGFLVVAGLGLAGLGIVWLVKRSRASSASTSRRSSRSTSSASESSRSRSRAASRSATRTEEEEEEA